MNALKRGASSRHPYTIREVTVPTRVGALEPRVAAVIGEPSGEHHAEHPPVSVMIVARALYGANGDSMRSGVVGGVGLGVPLQLDRRWRVAGHGHEQPHPRGVTPLTALVSSRSRQLLTARLPFYAG